MSTIETLSTWATTFVKRSDLTSESIDLALEVYKLICQKIPFEGLQQKSGEISAQSVNGAALDTVLAAQTPALPAVAGIMSIRYTKTTNQSWRLRRSHSRTYDAISFSTSSDPRTYARFGNTIELMPSPSSATPTVRFRYWTNPTIHTTPKSTVLLWPDAWDALGKWETLYRLYYMIGEPEKAMTLIQPAVMPRQASPRKHQMFEVGIIPRLWNDLLATISQRENVDEDFSINPIVRSYTSA